MSFVFHIRNMICDRCKMVVRAELIHAGLHPLHVELGEAEVAEKPTDDQLERVKTSLEAVGFSLIDSEPLLLAELIRIRIIRCVWEEDAALSENLSDLLSREFGKDYDTLSAVFQDQMKNTIGRFFILQRITRVREMMEDPELTMSEIAARLNYSSPAHLSRQFKQVSGYSPSEYRKLGLKRRSENDQDRQQ